MSHWTKTTVLAVGLAAGVGAGVGWISPSAGDRPVSFEETVDIRSAVAVAEGLPASAASGVRLPHTVKTVISTDYSAFDRSALQSQTGEGLMAQAAEPSPDSSSEEDADAPEDRDANSTSTESSDRDGSSSPSSQSTPQPQFSPVTPRPLDNRSTTDPQAEIRAIRRELIELLARLDELEAQLDGGGGTSNSSGSNSSANNSGSSASSFFDGPPPPQLSLGTQTISLPGDVLFDFNRSDIRPEAEALLEQVVGILETMPFSHIQVAGHTDDVGDNDYNLVLSVERATAVQEFLKEALPDNGQGYRWTSTGYGEVAPVADNDSEEGRQRNRRVDLIVSPQ